MIDIFAQGRAQVPFAVEQQAIGALGSHRPDPALGEAVRLAGLEAKSHHLRLPPSDLTPRHRHLVTQHHDFCILRRLTAAQQHQPAQLQEHDQTEQAGMHRTRSFLLGRTRSDHRSEPLWPHFDAVQVFADRACDDASSADGSLVVEAGDVVAGLRCDVQGSLVSRLVRRVPVVVDQVLLAWPTIEEVPAEGDSAGTSVVGAGGIRPRGSAA
ncbi:hypothetical protein ABGB18_40795 [Nonomuraea sp. B12E4]|uniref:hypothetical protein n=1 Tax=Nonomuraea sp. B12E4 TaxID=3153564 RepID=UPI00325D27CC